MPENEQLKKWKEQFGEVFQLQIKKGDAEIDIYLKSPEKMQTYFGTMSRAIAAIERDSAIEAGEIILRGCYLGGGFGDNINQYNKETPEFLSACFYCSQLVTVLKGNFTTT